jgi:TRAP-type C4-dicarboxylate transport system permease small subunit
VTTELSTEPAPEPATRLDRIAAHVENAALTITMALLVGIAGLQLILRSVFDTTLLWADEFLRILVLWVALLGAVAAARTDRHLRIDVVHKLLGPRSREAMSSVASLVAAVIAGVIAYEAGRFTAQAYEFGDVVMGGVKQWPFLLIMPVGIGLIALWYLRNAVRHARRALAPSGERQ